MGSKKKAGKTTKAKGALGRGGSSKPQEARHDQVDPTLDYLLSLPLMARVEEAKPLWTCMSEGRRAELLSVDLVDLREAARQVAEAAAVQAGAAEDAGWGLEADLYYLTDQLHIEAMLEDALGRLHERGTWKVWHCHVDNTSFYDAEAYRHHVLDRHLPPELLSLLPLVAPRALETPSEEGLRIRMAALLERVTHMHNALGEECCGPQGCGALGCPGARGGLVLPRNEGTWDLPQTGHKGGRGGERRRGSRPQRCTLRGSCTLPSCDCRMHTGCAPGIENTDEQQGVRDFELQAIAIILHGLQREHPFLSQMVLGPVVEFIEEALPEGAAMSSASAGGQVHFDDLDRLSPEHLARICEWLTEKVDALSAQLKPDSKELLEQMEDDMGDIDLWRLSADGNSLLVTPRWLQHLQQRLQGPDGHPCRSKPDEDPTHAGLVLEWVYGCIVSTAEKARDAARRCLSMEPPNTERALACLQDALLQQQRLHELSDGAGKAAQELQAAELRLREACMEHGTDRDLTIFLADGKWEQAAMATAGTDASSNPGSADPGCDLSEDLKPQSQFLHARLDLAADLLADLPMDSILDLPSASSSVLLSYILQREHAVSLAEMHVVKCQMALSEQSKSGLDATLLLLEPSLMRLLGRQLDQQQLQQHKPSAASSKKEEAGRPAAAAVNGGLGGGSSKKAAMRPAASGAAAVTASVRPLPHFSTPRTEHTPQHADVQLRDQAAQLQAVQEERRRLQEGLNQSRGELEATLVRSSKFGALVNRLRSEAKLATSPEGSCSTASGDGGPGQELPGSSGGLLPRAPAHRKLSKELMKGCLAKREKAASELLDRLEALRQALDRGASEGHAALSHLEAQLINVACDDPGASVGLQLDPLSSRPDSSPRRNLMSLPGLPWRPAPPLLWPQEPPHLPHQQDLPSPSLRLGALHPPFPRSPPQVLPLLQQRLDIEIARHQEARALDRGDLLIVQEEEEKRVAAGKEKSRAGKGKKTKAYAAATGAAATKGSNMCLSQAATPFNSPASVGETPSGSVSSKEQEPELEQGWELAPEVQRERDPEQLREPSEAGTPCTPVDKPEGYSGGGQGRCVRSVVQREVGDTVSHSLGSAASSACSGGSSGSLDQLTRHLLAAPSCSGEQQLQGRLQGQTAETVYPGGLSGGHTVCPAIDRGYPGGQCSPSRSVHVASATSTPADGRPGLAAPYVAPRPPPPPCPPPPPPPRHRGVSPNSNLEENAPQPSQQRPPKCCPTAAMPAPRANASSHSLTSLTSRSCTSLNSADKLNAPGDRPSVVDARFTGSVLDSEAFLSSSGRASLQSPAAYGQSNRPHTHPLERPPPHPADWREPCRSSLDVGPSQVAGYSRTSFEALQVDRSGWCDQPLSAASPPCSLDGHCQGQSGQLASLESLWAVSSALGDLDAMRRLSAGSAGPYRYGSSYQQRQQAETHPGTESTSALYRQQQGEGASSAAGSGRGGVPVACPSRSSEMDCGGAAAASFSYFASYQPMLSSALPSAHEMPSPGGGTRHALLRSLMDELGPERCYGVTVPSALGVLELRERGVNDDLPLRPAAASHPKLPQGIFLPPPAHFMCPLTQRVMADPVVASDGFLYERKAVMGWLQGSMMSPVTGQPLSDRRLTPVHPLQTAIREWCGQQATFPALAHGGS